MEVYKTKLHMTHTVYADKQTISLDEDFIIPDSKPDIEAKIKEIGYVNLTKEKCVEQGVAISGELNFRILYASDKGCASMSGMLQFDELLTAAGVVENDFAKCDICIEDITAVVINSRKINVKAVVSINIAVKAIRECELVENMDIDALQVKKNIVPMLELVSSKKDSFKIRESFNIPSDYPNISNIIWYELEPRIIDFRATKEGLSVRGELYIFCIYTGESQTDSTKYINTSIPFSQTVEVTGLTDDMITDISVCTREVSLIARQDENMEMRILDGEIVLQLNLWGYIEGQHQVLSDAYSPLYEITPNYIDIDYENLCIKNSIVTRVSERTTMSTAWAESIIDCSGSVYVENITSVGDSIQIDGAISVDVMYMVNGTNSIPGLEHFEIPFSQNMDVKIESDYVFSCHPGSLLVSATLMGDNEIDIKCNAAVDVFITCPDKCTLIENADIAAPDYEKIKKLPGIVGYILKPGDTLWDIAKKYCTTVDDIMETNSLDSEELEVGTKLLVVKKC